MSQFSVSSAVSATLRPFIVLRLQERSEAEMAARPENSPRFWGDTPKMKQGERYYPLSFVDTNEVHSALSATGLGQVVASIIDAIDTATLDDATAKQVLLQLMSVHKQVNGLPDNRVPLQANGWDAEYKTGTPYLSISSNRLGMGVRRADAPAETEAPADAVAA